MSIATGRLRATSGTGRPAASIGSTEIVTAGSLPTNSPAIHRQPRKARPTRLATIAGSSRGVPRAGRIASAITGGISRGSANWSKPTPGTTRRSARVPTIKPDIAPVFESVIGRGSARVSDQRSTAELYYVPLRPSNDRPNPAALPRDRAPGAGRHGGSVEGARHDSGS